jgi:uncharacterized tellurite resistance protein B-like protein
MNAAEWLALAGLIRMMLRADGNVSRREHALVSELATRLGPELWIALAKAEVELHDREDVQRAAARVVRPEPRAEIRSILEEVARADGMGEPERAVLAWLDTLWAGIEANPFPKRKKDAPRSR